MDVSSCANIIHIQVTPSLCCTTKVANTVSIWNDGSVYLTGECDKITGRISKINTAAEYGLILNNEGGEVAFTTTNNTARNRDRIMEDCIGIYI